MRMPNPLMTKCLTNDTFSAIFEDYCSPTKNFYELPKIAQPLGALTLRLLLHVKEEIIRA